MDEISIRGIKVFGHHGDLPEEVKLGQVFKVSLTLRLDVRPAENADDLALTVDYAAVIRTVETVLRDGPPARLIETLAGRVAGAVLRGFPIVEEVSVELAKPFAPVAADFECVSVAITRRRA